MKRRFSLYLIVTFFTISLTGKLSAQTNLALSATVSTSHVSSWETLEAVNDGITPTSSLDNTNGAYGNWNGSSDYNTYNYVQFSWDDSQIIDSTRVYWWDDGYGIDQPTDAYIQYYSDGSWVTAGSIGLLLDQFNSLELDVTTTGLRIYMKSDYATGILEWEAYEGSSDSDSTYSDDDDTYDDTDSTYSDSTYNDSDSTYNDNDSTDSDSTYDDTDSTNTGTVTGNSYTWPEYSPNISYNFSEDYGTLSAPTEVLDDCDGVEGTITSDWWCFRWGSDANSLVTEDAITPMLERFETDFSYFTDTMGWPRDLRAQDGYKSAIYLYGSGLCTDNASNTDLGGWQSAVYYNNKAYPIVLASYYPVYSFDPSCTYSDAETQQGAMVHEGIHSILASFGTCTDAAWFHEGGNTWLQQEADSRRSGDYSEMGFLNGANMLAPFMPIECYSGWLQDGTFGGPSAEGVNMYEDDGDQVCTWKNYLGGVQYGNMFPTIVAQILGDGAIPWIWKNCESRVLEGMADGLGETQMRRLICEYRAKQAVVDLGNWEDAVIDLLDTYMGTSIEEEWSPYNVDCDAWTATPYVETTESDNILTPAEWTLPGWSGANQIPLTVSDSSITVNFIPTGENMRCQLCYIAEDGTKVYSKIVESGNLSLNLDLEPANDVVIAVITNTNYIYEGETTRTAKYNYQLELVSGISEAADINTSWYKGADLSVNSNIRFSVNESNNPQSRTKTTSSGISSESKSILEESSDFTVSCYPNPISNGDILHIDIQNSDDAVYTVEIIDITGSVVLSKETSEQTIDIETLNQFKSGMYFATIQNSTTVRTLKFIIK